MLVSSIQHFCVSDGDGIRTTIFFKGCPLHCAWCHNPETNSFQKQLLYYPTKCFNCQKCLQVCPNQVHFFSPFHQLNRENCIACGKCCQTCFASALEISGEEYSIEKLVEIVLLDQAFYDKKGGVTLSGGEPLCQGEKLFQLIDAFKEKNIHIAVETCGYFDPSILEKIVSKIDLFLYDIKDSDSKRHKKYTGVENQKILDNLKRIDQLHGKTRLRCILVNGINTNVEHYESVAQIAKQLKHCEGVEWIAYHAYGGTKATFLGHEDNGNVNWIPSKSQIEEAKKIIKQHHIKVF